MTRSKKPWIKAVTSDLPIEVIARKKRYCGLCKSLMSFHAANDAWICRNTTCGAILRRDYGINPTKGDQEELVTITDPYGDLQKPFVKAIEKPWNKPKDYHGLKRPIEDKSRIAKSPIDNADSSKA